jgi:hypothetical protein
MSWEGLIDQLRPLGAKMSERLPPRLRDDPLVQAESQRLLLAATMRAVADAIIGDRQHPIFVPELNVVLNIFQPNADTIYKSALIEPGGRYRIYGERGSIRSLRMAQLGPDTLRTGQHSAALLQNDFDTLKLDAQGCFDVVLSAEEPGSPGGDWWPLHPKAEKLMIRFVSCDWGVERDPRMGIDRLDAAPVRPRLSAEELRQRFDELPNIIGNAATMMVRQVEKLREEGFINTLKVLDLTQMSGLARQSYYEGAYELADDEALVVSTRIPKSCGYWSLILTNPIYETIDWYNNQSSLNDVQARVDADGVFRAVISARDPGVPNWLDTGGYRSGSIQGRWLDCDESPVPEIRKLKVADVRSALPPETPQVTRAQRDAALRERRLRAQMRTVW